MMDTAFMNLFKMYSAYYEMGQLVSGYLNFAERQAEREIPMTMEDWAKHLDGIYHRQSEISPPCRDNIKMILSRLVPYNIRLNNMRGNTQDIYSFFTHFATFRTACSKLTTGV